MNLLDTIYKSRTLVTTIKWPNTEILVNLRILGKTEQQEASFAATKRFAAQEIPVSAVNLDLYKEEETIQQLWRALSDGEGAPLTPSIDAFRARLNTDDIDELSRAYTIFEAEVSPNMEAMEEAEFEAFLAALKKKPEEMLGSVRSIAFARRLLRSLAAPPPT